MRRTTGVPGGAGAAFMGESRPPPPPPALAALFLFMDCFAEECTVWGLGWEMRQGMNECWVLLVPVVLVLNPGGTKSRGNQRCTRLPRSCHHQRHTRAIGRMQGSIETGTKQA